VRTFERLFRRAGLRLRMSEGFHPKPRMTFPSALSLGIQGENEVMEVVLSELPEGDLAARLNELAPEGLRIREARPLAAGQKKARIATFTYRAAVPEPLREALPAAAERLLAADRWEVPRPDKGKSVDVRAGIESIDFDGRAVTVRVRESEAARPREIFSALGLDDLEHDGQVLSRSDVELAP